MPDSDLLSITRKVLITGPESSGKTSLAQSLSEYFDSPWIAEYAREFLMALDRPYEEADLEKILQGQLSRQHTAIDGLHPFLFCDTGPEVLYIWSQVKYRRVSPTIQNALLDTSYDVRIICYPDLEWDPDPLREAPDNKVRLELFETYCELHEDNGWPYFVAKGRGKQRLIDVISYL